MTLLYDRKETDNEVIIIYKYRAAFYIVLLAAILLTIPEATQSISYYIAPFILLFGVFWIIGHLKPSREIKRAMKNGKVKVTGSKFSFTSPLTFTIKK